MKKYLSVVISLIIIILLPFNSVDATSYDKDIIQPKVKVDWSVPVTVYRNYALDEFVPSEIFVTKSVGGYTYNGYIKRVSFTLYNTGRSEATFSGTLILSQ